MTRPRPSAKEIIAKVSERTGVSVAEIHGRSKVRRIAQARQRAIYGVRQSPTRAPQAQQPIDRLYTRSFPTIAALFGRDHTTIIHDWRRHAARRGHCEAQP